LQKNQIGWEALVMTKENSAFCVREESNPKGLPPFSFKRLQGALNEDCVTELVMAFAGKKNVIVSFSFAVMLFGTKRNWSPGKTEMIC